MSKLLPAYPDETREQAKQLYMAHVPLNDIASQLKVPTATLSQWRSRDGWLAERETADESLAADIVSSRKLTLARIAKASIDQIDRTIKHIAERAEPATVAEAEKLSVLVSNLDRVARLDNKEATENVSVKVKAEMTVDRIREVIQQDAFMSSEPDKET